MCIQDYRGHFLQAATFWHDGSPPPQEAEAIGLGDAISWLGRLIRPVKVAHRTRLQASG
jgi:hypothetical protein